LDFSGVAESQILEMAVVLVAMLRTRAAVVVMLQAAVHPGAVRLDRRIPQLKPDR